jgi:CRP-like cAMP-binding protein
MLWKSLTIKAGEIIYRQGDPPDAFYCIISGRVEVFVEKGGHCDTLEHIHRGKYFGFISLLTGEPHSVSARAVNDTVMARIPGIKFKEILHRIPRLAIDLSQMLSRRLKRRDLHPKTIFESTVVSFFGDPDLRRKTIRLFMPLI